MRYWFLIGRSKRIGIGIDIWQVLEFGNVQGTGEDVGACGWIFAWEVGCKYGE